VCICVCVYRCTCVTIYTCVYVCDRIVCDTFEDDPQVMSVYMSVCLCVYIYIIICVCTCYVYIYNHLCMYELST